MTPSPKLIANMLYVCSLTFARTRAGKWTNQTPRANHESLLENGG